MQLFQSIFSKKHILFQTVLLQLGIGSYILITWYVWRTHPYLISSELLLTQIIFDIHLEIQVNEFLFL